MSNQTLALLILVFPAAGALLLAGRGWRLPRIFTVLVGPGVVWASFVCVLALFAGKASGDFTYWTWIKSGSFDVPFNILIDNLSIFMCLVITGVGGLIVSYSVGYMEHEDDPSYARFFCYMDVFIFSMLLLVLAGNFVFLITGWALVGLSSYLLIGFWYQRHSAVVAARKAFVMNVIGDVGMILGSFVLFVTYHSATFAGVFQGVQGRIYCTRLACPPIGDTPTLELAAFLLLVGAIAKSAQLPLHTWLPDAMEGPTPVSALIHAATMVTAGVYLVGRMHPIYDVAVYAHGAVAIVGAVTALFAATIAIVQTDIKRVLAYSTMSQIGYMFLAVGIGAYSAGFFHLLSHAFFKALLFLAAGNIIHAMHDEQDMRKYGGLWNQMRPTSIAFLVGSLSLVGLIPFVGFFSKEQILGLAFARGDLLSGSVWVIGALTALLTGFYTGRMWWLAFWGKPSPQRPVEHPHEAPPVMLVPVAILAVLAAVGGLFETRALGFGTSAVTDFLTSVVGPQRWEESLPVVAIGLVTMILATALFYGAMRIRPWSSRVPWAQRLLERKYYFDDIYDGVFVRPLDRVAAFLQRDIEQPVIDAAVVDTGYLARWSAAELSLTQSGYFRNYVLVFVVGVVAIAGVLLLVRALT
ncbi:MAG: NADH-quinone oxidoreductase subunit L [Chloroflexi bacterium]|nr:MAG: NADH-quinone oxidoreductase subunit L [Chloroflexota bacterium]TMG66447.1 MAG: NADH-quinone oxidoreductase subunit L [Chloroflexota bacterium]